MKIIVDITALICGIVLNICNIISSIFELKNKRRSMA